MTRRPLTFASLIVLCLGFLLGPASAALAADESSRDATGQTGQGRLGESSKPIRPKGKLKKEVKKRVVAKVRAKRNAAGSTLKKDKGRLGSPSKDPKHELGAGGKSGSGDPSKNDDKSRNKHSVTNLDRR